ncbi:MAG TPA: hypothetical protein VHX68_06830 [Planctomycetaceae bacterium]|jgi:hypothetical protein|nr:hypothetical protein [Planctomycetaceae bacterium]
MGRRKREPPQTIVKEQKEAARILGTTDRSLRNWMRDPSFPDWSSGYPIEQIKAWAEEHRRTGSDAREQAQKLQLALKEEKVAEAQIRNEQRRLELAKQQGELLPRETVERALSLIATRATDILDQMPDIIRGVCSKKDQDRVARRVQQELDKWRIDLANALQSLGSR